MPMIIPFIPLIAAVAAPLLSKAIGGATGGDSGGDKAAAPAQQAAAAQASKNLFNPEQITQAQDRYKQQGTAKWNQILSNMGAGGGTGGPDVTTKSAIKQLRSELRLRGSTPIRVMVKIP